MSLLEALTMTSGLVYLVLLLWQGRSGWGWTLSLLLAAALWLLVADSVLWLALGLVATTLALWLRYRPLLMLAHIDSQRLRTATRQLLLLCWGLVAVQYVGHGNKNRQQMRNRTYQRIEERRFVFQTIDQIGFRSRPVF